MSVLGTWAEELYAHGLQTLPLHPNKRPTGEWKHLIESKEEPNPQNYREAIGVVLGKVSGGVMCLDFDLKNGSEEDWQSFLDKVGYQSADLLDKCYVERSPSGGYHVMFLSANPQRKTILARNADGKGLVEFLGTGNYVVVAPSPNYTAVKGSLVTLQVLAESEEEVLISSAKALNVQTVADSRQAQRGFVVQSVQRLAPAKFGNQRTQCDKCGARRGVATGTRTDGSTITYCHACRAINTPTTNGVVFRQPSKHEQPAPQEHVPTVTNEPTTNLHRFLIGLPQAGEPMAMHLRQWCVGSCGDETVFAYGNVASKFVAYATDGKRLKHKKMGWYPTGQSIPLFGVQWLSSPTPFTDYRDWSKHTYDKSTTVVLVESEKSAVLASFLMPQCIWLACGGLSGLAERKARVLRDRRVMVLFDNDEAGRTGTATATQLLKQARATVLPTPDLYTATDPDGYDIGDWVIKQLQQPLEYNEEYERMAIQWEQQWTL